MKPITYFKALADETRIRVLHLLMHQELNVNEIVAILGMGQSRISRHLKILSESGLLCSRRNGLWNFYSAATTEQAKAFIDGITPLLKGEALLKTDLDRARSVFLERKRESKKFFNSIAGDWDRIKKELLDGFDLNALIANRITPCGTSVDAGCGTGDLLVMLKDKAQRVIGVDNSPAMLERARVRFSGDGDSIDLRLGEIEHLPLSDGEAECAVLNMVLHHLASPLEGIREVAPKARVTYSADASAPTAGSDVGVVVVGETPYAEGYGDVGGPECGFCTPAQLEEKSLSLQPGDKAVIDKVCSVIATCVVLVVSGRPQLVTDQLGEIDALVASWLPGSEGGGVADVLFGRRPFTGRLPVTWPREASQVPINVGDRTYQPLFPFGWGLRIGAGKGSTVDRARDRAQAAVVAGRARPDWAKLIADADHALATGDQGKALALLNRVPR